MYDIVRIMTETQRMCLSAATGGGQQNKSRILAQVKIPAFDGHEGTTVRKYKEWRRELEIVQILNRLTEEELAMLLYTQVTGRAKQLIEVLKDRDFNEQGTLQYINEICDDAFEKST